MPTLDSLSRPFHGCLPILAVALTLAACGGGGDDGGTRPIQPGPPAAVNVVTGDAQQGAVGEELSAPLVVRVVDAAGHGVAGQSVSFVVTQGGGSAYAGAAITNASGQAQERWTLGTVVGPQKLEARAVDPQTGAKLLFATFNASAVAGPLAALTKVAGDAQTAAAGAQLPTTLAVQGKDRYGNLVTTGSVTWSVAAGGGSVAPAQSAFDAQGRAQAAWTLGATVGAQSLTATVGAISATFSAAATTPPLPLRWAAMSSPTTRNLLDVWGSSATDVWAVGEGGTIVHFDGATWKSVASGTTVNLVRVWGTSASSVYAISADDAVLLHFDGSAWSSVSAPPRTTAPTTQVVRYWINSPTDALAVLRGSATGDSVMHWDGTAWTTVLRDVPFTSSVWMAPDGRALITQSPGTVWRFDGTSWQSGGISGNLGSIMGKSYADAFLTESGTGTCCTLHHFNGTSFDYASPRGSSTFPISWSYGWFVSTNEVYSFDSRNRFYTADGSRGLLVRLGATASGDPEDQGISGIAIWGVSPTQIFVVGAAGSIYRRAP